MRQARTCIFSAGWFHEDVVTPGIEYLAYLTYAYRIMQAAELSYGPPFQ